MSTCKPVLFKKDLELLIEEDRACLELFLMNSMDDWEWELDNLIASSDKYSAVCIRNNQAFLQEAEELVPGWEVAFREDYYNNLCSDHCVEYNGLVYYLGQHGI